MRLGFGKLSTLFAWVALGGSLLVSQVQNETVQGSVLADVERRAVASALNDLLERIQEDAEQIEGEEVFVRFVREWQEAQSHTCLSQEQYKELVKKQTSSGFLLFVSELEASSQSQSLGEDEKEDLKDTQMLLAFYQDLQERVAVAGILSQVLAKGCGFNPQRIFREVSQEVRNELCRRLVKQDGQDADLLLQMRNSGLCPVRM